MSPIAASASRRRGGPTSASTGGCRGVSSARSTSSTTATCNAPVYINANLPAAESAFTGVDNRPRWVATRAPVSPACADGTGGQVGPCVTRLNNAAGNPVTADYVIKNQNQNRSWNIAASLTKTMTHGFSARGGFNYGVSRSLVEPSSTAGSSWGSANPIVLRPEQSRPGVLDRTRPASGCSFRPPTPTPVLRLRQHRRFGVLLRRTPRPTATPAISSAGDANGDTSRATT